MRGTERIPIIAPEILATWPRPPESLLKSKIATRYERGKAALTAVLGGQSITRAARSEKLCPKVLERMAKRAPEMHLDGLPNGYRVCVPWGTYRKAPAEAGEDPPAMPDTARPHAMEQLLAAQPLIREWVDNFRTPLPPGRPPRTFTKLHNRIVAELKRQDLGAHYPLNKHDQGHRALLRYLRRQHEAAVVQSMNEGEKDKPATSLADYFKRRLFDRVELDAHRIDIEAQIAIPMPNGGQVRRRITTMWLLCIVEVESRAIVGWLLRVGRSYNNEDVALCVARALEPWQRRVFTVPGLQYLPGAGMPSGLSPDFGRRRALLMAMDNAWAHHAEDFEDGYCRAHDGVLNTGRSYEPQTRPIIEALFGRLESGAFRLIPGGFEPAKRLGDNKILISNFSADDCPIQLHLFEELLEMITTAYNGTEHPALGNLTPLQFLQIHGGPPGWFYDPPDNSECADDVTSVIVPVRICGNKQARHPPYIHYKYADYRATQMDDAWDLIGKTFWAKVSRRDVRTLTLYRSATEPMGIVRARPPWNLTRHDETTRCQIHQWVKQGRLRIDGVECAVQAWMEFLRSIAVVEPVAVDQLARAQQQYSSFSVRPPPAPPQAMVVPRQGWVSFDSVRDTA